MNSNSIFNDGDARGSCGVGDSVVNQIAEDTVDEACVALHFHMVGHLYGWRDVLSIKHNDGMTDVA